MTPKEITLNEAIDYSKGFTNQAVCADSPIFIGIAGQSASGKSTIAGLLSAELDDCSVFNMDDYLVGLNVGPPLNHDPEDKEKPYFAGINPRVYDLDLMHSALSDLNQGLTIQRPIFDEVTKSRVGFRSFAPTNILIVDGIYALDDQFRPFNKLSLLVEAPLYSRLVRKIFRNHFYYGQDIDGIIFQYLTRDEPTYQFYQEELQQTADFVVANNTEFPIGDCNTVRQEEESTTAPTHILVPKNSLDFVSSEGQISLVQRDNEIIFRCAGGGKRVTEAKISPETLRTLENYYNFIETNQ